MGYRRTLSALESHLVLVDCDGRAAAPAVNGPAVNGFDKPQCLEQLLQAFLDIADRDDIHQAAARLLLIQQWIRDEAVHAAADPIFAEPVPA
jgi:hypothetical protein